MKQIVGIVGFSSEFFHCNANHVMKNALLKRQMAVIVLALMTFSCISALQRPGGNSIHRGAGNFVFIDRLGNPDKPISVWFYQPSGYTHDKPVLFVMHGVKRDAQHYRDEWIQYAENYGFLLIAPEFSHKYYPGRREYNEGNIFDMRDNPIPDKDSAFAVIEHLFDYIKAETLNQSHLYDIYGHSAGGQFVQRMVLFKTDARIRMAIAANPGDYVIASYSEKYPYGIRNSGITPDHLRAAFRRDFMLLLGEMDVNENDAYLARSPEAWVRGSNRFERGNNFYDSAKNEAYRLGMTYNWKMTTVPGAAHKDALLSQTAAFLFYKSNAKNASVLQ